MGILEIFNNANNFDVTGLSLLLLFFTSIYSGKTEGLRGAAWFLFLGVALELMATYVESDVTHKYAQGQAIEVWVFIELLILVASLVFLALAASQILAPNIPDVPVILGLGTLCSVASFVFIFIAPDGNMVTNMRQVFPIAAFFYVAISFWSQSTQKNSSGYFFAALVTSSMALFLVLRMFNLEFVSGQNMWYFPSISYILLSMALVMLRGDIISRKLESTVKEVNKYNNRIEEIIKSSPFPIIISRLSDDKIILANNNAVKLFGIHVSELERYRLRDFFADSDNRRLLHERLEQEREVQDFEILVKTPISDTPFWLLTSANVIDYNYDVVLYSAFQDITSRKNREVLLKNQAIRDPLTSIFNRRYFEDEVSKQILQAKTLNEAYSVLMLDADFFKKVNDTYGHKVGDKVLIELAATAERALRDDDVVARYGGEEFVVFLPRIGEEDAKVVADRLRETISHIVVYSDDNKPVTFTVSIGVSSNQISDNIDMLIKTADEALYRAKQNGRNRVEVFRKTDLDSFSNQERKEEVSNHHPVFDKEDNAEISLLDDVGAGRIDVDVDEKEGFYPVLGIDDEDLK